MSGFREFGLRTLGIVIAAGLIFGMADVTLAQDAKAPAPPAEAIVPPSDPVLLRLPNTFQQLARERGVDVEIQR
jgi:hypothetical protein